MLWPPSPGRGCISLQHLKYRKENQQLDSSACSPAINVAAHEGPWHPMCSFHQPRALASSPSSILPTTVEATGLCSSQWSSAPALSSWPKPASPSQAAISQAWPVSQGRQGTLKPLPALVQQAGTQDVMQGTSHHPEGQARTIARPND